jgi:uncharacterized membrane protein
MKKPAWLNDLNLKENWVWSLIAFLLTMVMFWITGVFSGGWDKLIITSIIAFILLVYTASFVSPNVAKDGRIYWYTLSACALFSLSYIFTAMFNVGTDYGGMSYAKYSCPEERSILFRSFFAFLVPLWAGIRAGLGR